MTRRKDLPVAAGRAPDRARFAGALALAGDYVDELVVGSVRDVHAAVASRAFGLADLLTGGASRGVQLVHDRVSGTVYDGVGSAVRAVSQGLRVADGRGLTPVLEGRPAGRHLVSAVNALVGDRLAGEHPELAIEMAVRAGGRDVPLDRSSVASAFPEAGPDVVVFLHGLGENDDSWNLRRDDHGGTYGSRLRDETGWTPVYLRANTGLPIAENGVALASLLDGLVASWPQKVCRLALVGHSMGGLIVRAAGAVVTDAETAWSDLVTNVVTLGTPHLGAPLERVVHAGSRALGMFPEAAPFGRILDYRSVGILDLRRGLAADVQHLPHARYHLVAATVGRSHRHPLSEVLGDLLVRYPSAVGRPRRGRAMFPEADILHVPEADHFALLNHPAVYDALRTWLG